MKKICLGLLNFSKVLNFGKVILFAIIIAHCSLFMVHCYTPSVDKEVGMIDSLSKQVSRSEMMLNKIDTVGLGNIFKIYSENNIKIHSFKKTMFADSSEDIIKQYESLFKDNNLKYNLKKYSDDIIFEKKQLEKLKYDLTNGRIPKSTFYAYYNSYQKSVDLTFQNTSSRTKYLSANISLYNKLNPKIIAFCSKHTAK